MQKIQEKKEKYDENVIKEILKEKIFSIDHIHSIYILFANLCSENQIKLTRSSLFDLFRRISQITNMKYEEEKIDLYHLQIDINKDGIITFDDFSHFITTIIKLAYNELYPKKGLNLLSSLALSNERKFFIDISSSIFSNIINYVGGNPLPLNNLNPFSYYDLSIKYLPFYKFYCNYKCDINMNNYFDSQKKFNEFNQMILNFTNAEFITGLQKLLNSQITSEYYNGLSLFKKSIKPLNYINTELLVIFYNKNIFLFLSVIIKSNLLNKVLMIFSIINNKENDNIISPEVIYIFLVIIRRILNLYIMLNETFLFCSEKKNKFMYHFIKEQINNFSELRTFIGDKILSPLGNSYNYFYEIFSMKDKTSFLIESKVKFVMYQLIIITSKIKIEYFNYFITSTNYLTWLINDVKNNLYENNVNNKNNIDYVTLENVIFNCINIIDIYLKNENYFLNENNNEKFLSNNIYVNISSIAKSLKDIIFNENNNNNFSLLNKINTNNISENNISIKSKYLCLLGLLNCLKIKEDNYNNINNIIKEFDNRKFILQIYTEEFQSKQKELNLPFCFYLKSLIINNKGILSLITELDILNNFYKYFSSNGNNNLISLSQFFDFCDLILQYTDPKILINNSNIINEMLLILNKMISENNKFLEDFEIKNRIIYLISEITDLNDVFINEKIINIKNIFSIIISYMSNNFYYIEEMNYINKKNIVFNIHLLDNGLNILNNITITNSNSPEKILEHFYLQNLEIIINIFDKISILWDVQDNSLSDNSEEISKNKYIFQKYKDLPKRNILIKILSFLENLLDYKEKIKISNNNTEQIFNYINDIDVNIRLKLRELKIAEEELTNVPTLVLYTQTDEEINQNLKSRFDMEIEGLTFYNFVNMIKEGYQSDVELSYKINIDNNIITRYIKTEKDFEIFIQEMIESYEKKPNKDNTIVMELHVELKEKKQKVKRNCINCGKEFEIELEIDKKKLEELNDFSRIENLEKFNKLINEANKSQICKECEKLILEHARNQINIENSKNNINNLSGINMSNLNITNNQNPNNTYQNILANSQLLNESILNNNILSSSLLNRTMNPGIGFNNNLNYSQRFGTINSINRINPSTPRKEDNLFSPNLINTSNFNNTFSSNISEFKILRTNNFQ